MSVGIFSLRFFILFLKVFMIGARYIAERIEKRAEPWPTLMLLLKAGKEKLF